MSRIPIRVMSAFLGLLGTGTGLAVIPQSAWAIPDSTLHSVVSVLPVWPDKPQGGSGAIRGSAPEGSGIAIAKGGRIATAYHVIKPAERVDVRLHDGRIVPAQVLGFDEASDVALLDIEPELPLLRPGPAPKIASRACFIANAYGLDLSVTCGVISRTQVSDAGFNAVEDFVQTDAAANPGSSGGALVDDEGRLVGMVSAIFSSREGMNIGVNFAVSSELLIRVADSLARSGDVTFVSAGWGLDTPPRSTLVDRAGVLVIGLEDGGPAQAAGVQIGDLVLKVRGRSVQSPRDVLSALAVVQPGETAEVVLWRNNRESIVQLSFAGENAAVQPRQRSSLDTADCPYSAAVCQTRQAVFPISSFDPLGSSVRIGETLLVTNRHITAGEKTATVYIPNGTLTGEVLPSAYPGDLALIRVEGLPKDGLILKVREPASLNRTFYTVGGDIAQKKVRVFPPGKLIAPPARGADLGRLHVSAHMQPGVSGGALVDETGALVGIATGGGQGRHEAIPLDDVADLIRLQGAPDARSTFDRLGQGLSECKLELEAVKAKRSRLSDKGAGHLAETCMDAANYGLLQEAGDALGQQNHVEEAIRLHLAALTQVPNSSNSRLSLLTAYQVTGRYEEMLQPARRLLELQPNSPDVLRRVLQAGVLGRDRELAEKALEKLERLGGEEAVQARRYFDKAESSFGNKQ
ncbi:trypsin-like peptidase domain-containing protein [Roseibium sediminis]|uniref:trypsin-like peptidase domain-containing protein n=1 Tax=Roseibium sediminis TaxID=1775174 RepID=UPI001375968D|nr:trypsin-like peptidase domain-containing protein [Roseibium sediminis]